MFEGLFNHIAALAQNDESVPDEIPCKSGILNIRECDKADKTVSSRGTNMLRDKPHVFLTDLSFILFLETCRVDFGLR